MQSARRRGGKVHGQQNRAAAVAVRVAAGAEFGGTWKRDPLGELQTLDALDVQELDPVAWGLQELTPADVRRGPRGLTESGGATHDQPQPRDLA